MVNGINKQSALIIGVGGIKLIFASAALVARLGAHGGVGSVISALNNGVMTQRRRRRRRRRGVGSAHRSSRRGGGESSRHLGISAVGGSLGENVGGGARSRQRIGGSALAA